MSRAGWHLLLALGHRDVHAILGEDVDKVRVVGQDHQRTSTCTDGNKMFKPGLHRACATCWPGFCHMYYHKRQAVCMLTPLTVDCCQLQLRAILGKTHALHLAALHSLDELRVAPLVALRQA